MAIYQNDTGVEFRVDVGTSLSESSLVSLKVKKPSGTEVTWTATIYSDHIIKYVTITGDLDEAGTYTVQSYAEWGLNSKHLGDPARFRVYRKWSA